MESKNDEYREDLVQAIAEALSRISGKKARVSPSSRRGLMEPMKWLRRKIYRSGRRPKPGTIFFSPSLAHIYAHTDAWESIASNKENN